LQDSFVSELRDMDFSIRSFENVEMSENLELTACSHLTVILVSITYFMRCGCKSQRTGSPKWPWRRIWLVSEINMKNVIVLPDNVSINDARSVHAC
jgi:hypothetical protein